MQNGAKGLSSVMPERNSEEFSYNIKRCKLFFHGMNLVNNHMNLSNALWLPAFGCNLFAFNVIDQLCE
uniref:Uncharacterized protein n=2 Tax=Bartonella schoenbuchensis TaxID=165694 RepID=E6Z011_BARSR|nr:hypothetical protein B11C_40304 [Bartonella schoenbuchensis R1]